MAFVILDSKGIRVLCSQRQYGRPLVELDPVQRVVVPVQVLAGFSDRFLSKDVIGVEGVY